MSYLLLSIRIKQHSTRAYFVLFVLVGPLHKIDIRPCHSHKFQKPSSDRCVAIYIKISIVESRLELIPLLMECIVHTFKKRTSAQMWPTALVPWCLRAKYMCLVFDSIGHFCYKFGKAIKRTHSKKCPLV